MKINDISLLKEIEIDKTHIENFALELEDGTKKMKERFHNNAILERNKYIDERKSWFCDAQKLVFAEIENRVSSLLPQNANELLQEQEIEVNNLEKMVINVNDNLSVSFKMGILFLISNIHDNIDLQKLDGILTKFISKFKEAGIVLTIDDFSFTMFTKQYFETFFENLGKENFNEIMFTCFEKIYFECPKIIMHIRNNLHFIVDKYTNQLTSKMDNDICQYFANNNTNKERINSEFIKKQSNLMWQKLGDLHTNLELFLTNKRKIDDYLPNSSARINNFQRFKNSDIDFLDEKIDLEFNSVIFELYGVLNEIKEFYRYEVILKDLIKRYKDKDSVKTKYDAKNKELVSVNKKRIKLNNTYVKSCKKDLFGRINREKAKSSKLNMNQEMINLDQLTLELDDIKFNKLLIENNKDVASIYDLFSSSLLSYTYLEKQFIDNFSSEENFSLEKEFNRFIKFLFNEYNSFLRKSNAFTEYDMAILVADKYKILGLNIEKEDIVTEKIDETLDIVKYIVVVLSIDNSNLSFDDMNFICKYNAIKEKLSAIQE